MSLQFTAGVQDAPRGDEAGTSHDGAAPLVLQAGGGDTIVVPLGAFVLEADYARSGSDLVLSDHAGHEVVVRDYFASSDAPSLSTEGGAVVAPDLVARLAGVRAPGQYAAEGDTFDAQPIGKVSEIDGECTATRVDGSKVTLAKDMPIFQGDVIETDDGGALAVTFVDQSTFSVGADARMVVDELVFDPSTLQGSSSVSLLQGVFVFVSGEIAANNPEQMLVRTPVATIGIRGTATAVEAHQEGQINRIVLLPEKAAECVAAGGNLEHCGETVGSVRVFNEGGSVVLDEKFETTAVDSIFSLPTDTTISTPEQVAFLLRQLSEVVPDSVGAVTERREGAEGTPGTGETFLQQDGPGAPNTDAAEEFSSEESGDAGDQATTDELGDGQTGEEGEPGEEGASLAGELSEIAPAAGPTPGDAFNNPFTQVTDGSPFAIDAVDSIVPDPISQLIGQPTTPTPPSNFFIQGPPAPPPAPPPGSAGGPAGITDGTEGNEEEEIIQAGGGDGEIVVPPPGGGGGGVVIPAGLTKLADSFTTNANLVSTSLGFAPSTGTTTGSFTFTTTGQHLIAFGNFDEGDFVVESALFLDNIRLNGALVAGFNGTLGPFVAQSGTPQFDSGPGILPTEGAQQLVLFQGLGTAAQTEAFLNLPAGTLSALADDGNPLNGAEVATDGALIFALIDAQAGDVLTFDFNFLDIENDGPGQSFNDFAFFFAGLNGVANLAPEITQLAGPNASDPIFVAENTDGGFITITATDPENQALTFSIGANPDPSFDNTFFTIDSATGALGFVTPPDFEFTDPGDDDLYKVRVTVTDSLGSSSFRDYFVQVTDVSESAVPTPFDDTLVGTTGVDVISALAGNDLVFGLAGNDVLNGDEGNDGLFGDAGDDTLTGGAGDDDLGGGADNDTYVFSAVDASVLNEDLLQDFAGGIDTLVFESGPAFDFTADNSGDLSVLYGELELTIDNHYTGATVENALANFGFGLANYLISTSTTTGGSGNDIIAGVSAGQNVISGGGGGDALFGHLNDDALSGDSGNDYLQGGAGNDNMLGGDDDDILDGGTGNDGMSGGSGDDELVGGAGFDVLIGGAGDDQLEGGADDDSYVFFSEDPSQDGIGQQDFIVDTSGLDDTVHFESGTVIHSFVKANGSLFIFHGANAENRVELNNNYVGSNRIEHLLHDFGRGLTNYLITLDNNGTGGDDLIVGAFASSNTINGNGGNDILQGGVLFNDTLSGGFGDDLLFAFRQDTLFGNEGADTFRFISSGESETGTSGVVFSGPVLEIGGFSGFGLDGDTLEINNTSFTFDVGLEGSLAEIFATTGQDFFSTVVGYDGTNAGAGETKRFIFDSVSRNLFFDVDVNDPFYLVLAHFDGVNPVTAADIVLSDFRATTGGLNIINGIDEPDSLVGTAGADLISGFGADDTLLGNGGNDTLLGGDGNDTLNGGAGDDTLTGGEGDDQLNGGANDDTYNFFVSDADFDDQDLVLDVEGGNDTLVFEAGPAFDFRASNAGDLQILYGLFGVTVDNHYTNGTVENALADFGFGLENYLISTSTTTGGAGNDIIAGLFASQNIINGGDGNDALFGHLDDDVLQGESGNDYIQSDAGNDTLTGGKGSDILKGGANDDIYVILSDESGPGGIGQNDLISDVSGFDTIDFEPGTAILDIRRSGNDLVFKHDASGSGFNTLTVDGHFIGKQIEQFIYDGGDGDVLYFIAIDTEGTGGNDLLVGGGGFTTIDGNGGDDLLFGSSAFGEVLDGDFGDDVLFVGRQDTLTGGVGSDSFVFRNNPFDGEQLPTNTPFAGPLTEITDFSGSGGEFDTFVFLNSAFGFGTVTEGTLQEIFDDTGKIFFSVINNYAGDASAVAGENVRFVFDPISRNLYFDNAVNVQGYITLAHLDGVANVTAADIELSNFRADTNIINGNGEENSLVGTAGNDLISGFGANDTLLGNGGDDLLLGGTGDDTLDGGAGSDILQGEQDSDLYLVGVDDALNGDDESIFDVSGTNDRLSISDAAPILGAVGAGGIVSFVYGAGPTAGDIIIIGQTANAGFQIEQIEYSFFTGPSIYNFSTSNTTGTAGDGSNDLIVGNIDNPGTISGDSGDDVLFGQLTGGETLVGGAGSDILFSGGVANGVTDVDTLTGGADADFFAFVSPDEGIFVPTDTAFGGARSVISDFGDGADEFVFFNEGFGFTEQGTLAEIELSTGNNFFSTIADFAGDSNSDPGPAPRFIFDPNNNTLYFDSNVDLPGYTVIAQVQAGANVTAADIRLDDFANGA